MIAVMLSAALLFAAVHDPSLGAAPPTRSRSPRRFELARVTGRSSPSQGGRSSRRQALGPTHGGVAIDRSGASTSRATASAHPRLRADGKLEKTIAEKYSGCHSLLLVEEKGEEFLYAPTSQATRSQAQLDGTPV